MAAPHRRKTIFRTFNSVMLCAAVMLPLSRLGAQGIQTVQQSAFRSQWVGDQVDLIPLGGVSSLNSLGSIVGSLQTPDQTQREVEASLANLKTQSPFAIKPSLGLGWQVSNQGTLNQSPTGSYYSSGSSPFIAPGLALLYDRDHGPWSFSAGYAVGYKYYSNANFVANGTGSQRNPFSQTGFFKAVLAMSRYIVNTLFNASSGNGYDTTSGSNNRQTAVAASMGTKYILSSSSALATDAGGNFQNYSGSVATPNNNTTSLYADCAPIYDLSGKTHLSAIFGVGSSAQTLQQGTASGTNTILVSNQTNARDYAQIMGKVKYDITSKLVIDAGLGTRYITSTYPGDSQYEGLRASWALGISYTPTSKTSITLSAGEQGSDVVPTLNLLLNWNPREKTRFSLGVSQSQSFANSLSSQYQVTQSILGTVSQKLFSSVDFQLSGGYGTQRYINLSSGQAAQSASQLPPNYYIASASLVWKIRPWVNLNNSVNYNGAQTVRGANNANLPQTWYSISLNFAL